MGQRRGRHCSFRLSHGTYDLITKLAEQDDLRRADVVTVAVRALARQRGLDVPPGDLPATGPRKRARAKEDRIMDEAGISPMSGREFLAAMDDVVEKDPERDVDLPLYQPPAEGDES